MIACALYLPVFSGILPAVASDQLKMAGYTQAQMLDGIENDLHDLVDVTLEYADT